MTSWNSAGPSASSRRFEEAAASLPLGPAALPIIPPCSNPIRIAGTCCARRWATGSSGWSLKPRAACSDGGIFGRRVHCRRSVFSPRALGAAPARRACPPHAIVTVPADGGLAAGTPHIDPVVQSCIACPTMPCVSACPTPALTPPPNGWTGYRIGVLEFHPERCITYRGSTCQVCVQACPVGESALSVDEAGHPVLRAEGCVGCGVCAGACVTTPSSFELSYLGA
jgi:ferredoxin-type protein NapG